MAIAVTFDAPQGLTLTLELYPESSDTIANGAGGDAATERTNDKGRYDATVAEDLAAGVYHARIKNASNQMITRGYVRLAGSDTTASVVGDYPSEAASLTAATIWAYAARTLTQSAAELEAAISGTTLTRYRDTRWTITITGLGNISARTKLYFTARRRRDEGDSESLLQVEETDGLLVCDGEVAGTPTDGSLTVDNETLGNVTVVIKEAANKLFDTGTYYYDFKMLTASGAQLLSSPDAELVVKSAVTRAIT